MKTCLLIFLSLMTVAPFSYAHPKQHKVRVLGVEPVYEYIYMNKPSEYCVNSYPSNKTQRINNIILGGVVGGAIGHISHSRPNKTNARAIGAIIGGLIGSQISVSPQKQIKAQCITHDRKSEKIKTVAGYYCWYKIKGKTYRKYSVNRPPRYVLYQPV